MAQQQRILVSIATYNERDNIEPLLKEIHHHLPKADILIIDDSSPDGTGQFADQLADADPQLTVLHRSGKLGLGTAILTGMRYAIDQKYDLFVNMDGDFSHHPRYLPNLITGMEKFDVTIGSRYVPGGGTENWPLKRRFMSKSVNVLCRLLMRLPAQDCSGGLRCYRVACLAKAPLDNLYSYGYSFQQEVLYRCWKAGCRIGEVPIVFADRKKGNSKANVKEMIRSLSILVYLGLKAMFGRPMVMSQ